MKTPKPQKWVIVKHVLATSVEDAVKKEKKFPVMFSRPYAEEEEPLKEPVGFR